jgi:hypothetical protein
METRLEYKEYYRLREAFKASLTKYVIENNCVDQSYYIALLLLIQMGVRAYRDSDYLEIVSKWFLGGMTLELIDALEHTSYDHNNLAHFNAMALLDSVSCQNKH